MTLENSNPILSTSTELPHRPGAKTYLLPETAITLWGLVYNPKEDVWLGSSAARYATLKFSTIRDAVSDLLMISIKIAFIELCRKFKSSSTYTIFHELRCFLKWATSGGEQIDHISQNLIEAYWVSRPSSRLPCFWPLRSLFQILFRLGNPEHGIDYEAMEYIERLQVPLPKRSDAVATWDPVNGPFTDLEDQCLLNALSAAFEKGQIEFKDYVIIMLFRFSGMRRSQIADLKVCDLRMVLREDGGKEYTIMIPRGKVVGAQWRSSFASRTLTATLGAVVEGFVEHQKRTWSHLDCKLEDIPMFPNPNNMDPIRRYHSLGDNCGDVVTRVSDRLKVTSRRTESSLHVHTKRFRETLATWAFRSGASIYEVAELLDLRSTDSLQSYMAIDPEILEEIDGKMACTERPLANAFLGKFSADPIRPGDAIYSPVFRSPGPVGGCACKCERPKPFACYICGQFQALMEGPHDEVLQEALRQHGEVIKRTGNATLGGVLQGVIDAIRNVIEMRNVRYLQDCQNTNEGGQ